jgi:hypothetical protein
MTDSVQALSFPDRVREFFTLADAARQLESVPEATRASLHHDMRLAFQKREAAETLWPRGSSAEALALARAGVEAALAALAALPEPHAAWVTRARALAEDAKKKIDGAKLPALEADVAPADEELFRACIDALAAIEETAGVSLAAPVELRRIRNVRIAGASAFAIVAVGLLAYALHKPPFSHATASAQLSGDYGADKAIDGDPSTWWLLPERGGGQGWIDLTLTSPRSVRALHLVAANPPWNDRVVKEAHIDAMLGGAIVKSADVTFPDAQGKEPNWTDVTLDAPKSDNIRLSIKSSYHQNPGGFAEVEIK